MRSQKVGWNNAIDSFKHQYSKIQIIYSITDNIESLLLNKVNSTTMYVVKIHSDKPNGMVVNPLGQVHVLRCATTIQGNTVKPVCNDHLYNKIYYLWLIQ